MTGKFLGIKPPEPPHRCDLPGMRAIYTVWRCDCGMAYRLEEVRERNELFLQWKRHEKDDASWLGN